jgi:hypothetical protein
MKGTSLHHFFGLIQFKAFDSLILCAFTAKCILMFSIPSTLRVINHYQFCVSYPYCNKKNFIDSDGHLPVRVECADRGPVGGADEEVSSIFKMVTYEEERDQTGAGADATWFFLTLLILFFLPRVGSTSVASRRTCAISELIGYRCSSH